MARTYKYHFIYHIRILIGSKKDYFYVGMHSTNNIDDGYCGSGKRVSDIIDSYKKRGYKDNEIYERTILTFATSRVEANELESIYVNKNILLNEFSLNDKTGGDANIEYSDETCAKMSKNRKGKCCGDKNPSKRNDVRTKISKTNSGENNAMFGKNNEDFMTPEAIAIKRQRQSVSTKQYHEKHPEAMKGKNNPMYGKGCKYFMTEDEIKEWGRKISEKNSGKNNPMFGKNSEDFMTPEAIKEKRRKQSEKNKGKNKGKHPYNNGEIEIRRRDDEVIPDGFVRGTLKKSA